MLDLCWNAETTVCGILFTLAAAVCLCSCTFSNSRLIKLARLVRVGVHARRAAETSFEW